MTYRPVPLVYPAPTPEGQQQALQTQHDALVALQGWIERDLEAYVRARIDEALAGIGTGNG